MNHKLLKEYLHEFCNRKIFYIQESKKKIILNT